MSDEAHPDAITIEVRWGGPLVVRGPVEVTLADGTVVRRTHAALCRCGFSSNKPFCDGSHAGVGFRE
jgi:CDGSH-type Zn-finger protein